MAKQAQSGRASGRAAGKAGSGRPIPPAPHQAALPATISLRWLAGAIAIVIAVAAVCAYATLCLLFYQGQWQMVLHPSRSVTLSPASRGLKFDDIHLDYTETGMARLAGWWIPADPASRWSAATVLYLHSGDGSLSESVDDLAALHALGINVFAFDYRGFGQSSERRPSEQHMAEDTRAAWSYLTGARHLDGKSIVIYGVGVGASLAAQLAAQHNPAGVILDGPSEPARMVIERDARARILPLWLLETERFDPVDALQDKQASKLFLDRGTAQPRTQQLYRAAALPKEYFELKQSGYDGALRRFLNEILP